MLYLVFAILCSTSILIVFKLFKVLNVNTLQAIVINYLVAAGFGLIQSSGSYNIMMAPEKPWFQLAILSSVLLIAGFNLYAYSTQKAGVAITAIAGRMSVVIPVSIGFVVFGDPVTTIKSLGIGLVLIALYLILKKDTTIIRHQRFYILPLLLFFTQGTIDTVFKTAQHHYITDDFVPFLSTAFFFCLILGIIILFIKKGPGPLRISLITITAGVVLGLLNWFSTLFVLKGLGVYQVSFFLPVMNVSIVALSALAGFLVFREKLNRLNLTGIILAILAILFLRLG